MCLCVCVLASVLPDLRRQQPRLQRGRASGRKNIDVYVWQSEATASTVRWRQTIIIEESEIDKLKTILTNPLTSNMLGPTILMA